MKDDQTRVLVSSWLKIKNYVPAEDENSEYTPKFGYIIDYIREYYGIYIIAKPVTNSDLDRDTNEPLRVYNFRGETTWIKMNFVFKFQACTNISYYGAIREAIDNAITFLEENEVESTLQ